MNPEWDSFTTQNRGDFCYLHNLDCGIWSPSETRAPALKRHQYITNSFLKHPCLMDASVETCTPVICFESQSRELNGGLHDTLQDAICFLHKQMEPLYSCYSTPPIPFHAARHTLTHSYTPLHTHTLCYTLDTSFNPKPPGRVRFSASKRYLYSTFHRYQETRQGKCFNASESWM